MTQDTQTRRKWIDLETGLREGIYAQCLKNEHTFLATDYHVALFAVGKGEFSIGLSVVRIDKHHYVRRGESHILGPWEYLSPHDVFVQIPSPCMKETEMAGLYYEGGIELIRELSYVELIRKGQLGTYLRQFPKP